MNKSCVQQVVIVGGGTAGWMTAAALSSLIGKDLDITLIESDEISTVGVGEATIPPLLTFLRLLKIDEKEFMAATNATFKVGINFENWKASNEEYFHSFGTTGKDCWAATFHNFWLRGITEGHGDGYDKYCLETQAAMENRFAHLNGGALHYAYHLDASLFAKLLREKSETHGVKRVEGRVVSVAQGHSNGFIESVTLESGKVIGGTLFIDCSGFKGLLIEQTLNVGYEDWSHWLPCDRAVAVQTKSTDFIPPYTRSMAHEAGWQWRIPLQNRVGNGLVYCSKYLSDEDAKAKLVESLDAATITTPKIIHFRTGRRLKHWHKNCVAIGLSSGFLEPLESTSIHLIQRSIIRLMQLFPSMGFKEPDVNEFNRQAALETEFIRDFIILHYKVTQREDSPFWRYCKSMEVPSSLSRRIELFKQCGRIFREDVDLFVENSWVQVLMGQGVTPEQYHPIANMMTKAELDHFLTGIKNSITKTVLGLPSHKDYLQSYCPSNVKK